MELFKQITTKMGIFANISYSAYLGMTNTFKKYMLTYRNLDMQIMIDNTNYTYIHMYMCVYQFSHVIINLHVCMFKLDRIHVGWSSIPESESKPGCIYIDARQ